MLIVDMEHQAFQTGGGLAAGDTLGECGNPLADGSGQPSTHSSLWSGQKTGRDTWGCPAPSLPNQKNLPSSAWTLLLTPLPAPL